MELENDDTKKRLQFLGLFFLICFITLVWQFHNEKVVKENGVYTKCIITDVLPYKGGVRVEIDYSFRGKKYSSVTNYAGEGIKVGQQFFIKILPIEPETFNFENKLVPNCLLDTITPFDGWVLIPNCEITN